MDALLDRGLTCVTVLDVSAAALDRARHRLGPRARTVTWLEADVTGAWEIAPIDLWHDRAVFHFLTEPAERRSYVAHLQRTLKPSGHVVMGTFALDGPSTCSGLPVMRYSPESLATELGAGFELIDAVRESHTTPGASIQNFTFARFHRTAG